MNPIIDGEFTAERQGGLHISQVDKMGYQKSDGSYTENWFPWLDASNYQLFPVNAIPQIRLEYIFILGMYLDIIITF